MIDEYGDDFAIGYMIEDGELEYNVPESWDYEDADFNKEVAGADNRIIDATRLRYTSAGLDNKREIALTVPTIEPWEADDNIHFGDADYGRAIAWIRFGDARTGYNGEKGSRTIMNELERKYGSPDATEKMTDEDVARRVYANYLYRGDNADMDVLKNGIANMVSEDRVDNVTRLFEQIFDEREEGDRVLFIDEIQSNRHQEGREKGYIATNEDKEGVPDAPFEKNWQELAMKRMLRLAAEEGYDKIAWTPGEQQADRYKLAKIIPSITRKDTKKSSDKGIRVFEMNINNEPEKIFVNGDGTIVNSTLFYDSISDKPLSDFVGKDIAVRMMSMNDGETIDTSREKVGGDGMKTFYDQMLVNFMNKYGKQWGVKVEDLNLPDVEDGNYTFHSVDVTDQMKKDVMEGQTMFSIAGDFASALDDLETRGISIDDENLLDAYGLSNVTLAKKGDNVTLTHFIAKDKGKGNGTRFMNDLTKLADGNGWTLALTPDASFGATSVKRLKDFYKRFGFKDNKGRNTDFEINESMVRKPERFNDENNDIRYSIGGNGAYWHGRPFWCGSVNLLDGQIEEVHTYRQAEAASFHHSWIFSDQQVEKMDNGECAFFWIDDGKIEGDWRVNIPQNIIDKIKEQIKIIDKSDIRYSFVGERAASALKQNSGEWFMLYDLGQARIMKEQGRSPEWIKDVTGWEQGADGEWRYEMEDFKLRPDYTDAQTIGEAVEDNRLLKAYPDLKDMKVQFKHVDTPHSSYYDGKGFFVEYDNDDTAAKGLMHEVQHYIQVQEGFAEGANTDTFSDGKEHPLFNMDSNAVERVMAKANVAWDVDDNADIEDISKKINESKEGSAKYETYSEIYIMAASGMSIREAKDQIIAYAKNLTNDAVYLYSDPQSPLNKYRRTAGEVEARNVENRYDMTFEERMKSLASATEDVARENQIIIINGAIREYEEEIDPIMSPLEETAGVRYSISVEPSRIRSEYNDGDIKVYNPRDIADVQASVMRESYTHEDIRTMDGWDDLRDTAYRLSDGEIARRAVANGMDFDSAIEGWMYENAERMVVPFSRMLSRNGIDLMYEMTGDEIRMYLMSSNDLLDGAERFLMKEDLPVKESIRYSMASAPSARELYDASQGSFMNNLYRSYIDYTKPLRDVQEIIAKASGEPIKDFENALEAENQRSSKNKSEIEQFELRHFEKMRDAVKALRKATGMKYNDVLRYLIAKHGLERNVVLAERDAAATVATQQDLDNYRTKLTNNLADLKFQENQLVNQVAADADEQKIIDNKLKRIRKRIDNLERILAMNDDDFKQEVHDIEFKKNRKSDYSGLTALTGKNKVSDAEDGARTIVADVETRAKAESENLWKIIADAVDAIQKKKYESGMISKERMQHEKDMFEHYIPLRGFADPIAEDFYDYYGDTYRNRPQRDKKAKGRRSLADDPIATLGAMAASTIIEGNKNLVKQRFLNLVDNHPNDLATLKEGWVVNNGTPENPKWEPAYPVIKEDMDADAINAELKDYDKRMEMLQAMGLAKKVSNKLNIKWRTLGQQEQQHIITVRRNGKEQMIIINGNPQVEANFAEGLEDGPYTVYRENGVPYYQGTYSKGQRVGIWEFYDEEGNLDNTVDYSAKSSNNK